MNAISFAQQHLSALQLDDSSVALIALLVGMIGGYRLTSWHEQLKARRAKVRRPDTGRPNMGQPD